MTLVTLAVSIATLCSVADAPWQPLIGQKPATGNGRQTTPNTTAHQAPESDYQRALPRLGGPAAEPLVVNGAGRGRFTSRRSRLVATTNRTLRAKARTGQARRQRQETAPT
jgi:hypothetical protein